MNIFANLNIIPNKKTTTEQAQDLYRPKPSWAEDLTDDEWNKATEGLPKGKVRTLYFCSKDLPF